jgi:hypothetical protein
VPDRLGESTGEVDLGDFGAALLADAGFGLLVAVAADGRGAGVGGGVDERPACAGYFERIGRADDGDVSRRFIPAEKAES